MYVSVCLKTTPPPKKTWTKMFKFPKRLKQQRRLQSEKTLQPPDVQAAL